MMRGLWALFFGALAMSVLAGAFSVVEQGGEFQVLHRGKVLVSSVKGIGMNDGGLGKEPKASSATLKDGTRVWNRWSEHRDTRIRLEVALKGDGSEVEITVMGESELYAEERRRFLELTLPRDAVAGCQAEGLLKTGRQWLPKKCPAEEALNGELWRYLCFGGGDAAASGVVFDFNPLGAGNYTMSYASGSIRGICQVKREGGAVRITGGGEVPVIRGGVTGAKIVLREGALAEDYPTHHAWRTYGYNDRLAAARLYSFGAKKHGKMYQTADGIRYNKKRGYGWLGTPAFTAHVAAPEGALYSALAGKDATFRLGNLPPGLHFLNIECGNFGGAQNRFSLAVNGREVLPMQSVAKGELLGVAVPVWVTKGDIDIRFQGEFLVSAIGAGFLMAQAEDFTYKRGYWVADGYEPTILFQNADANPRAPMAVAVTRLPMPVPGEEAKGPLKKMKRGRAPHDPESPGLAWTKRAIVGKVGYNADTMDEVRDPAILKRRLDDLQADGVNTVFISGMHSRHTFPRSLERGVERVRQVTAAAHARGMKVVDHHDATLLWQENVGFRLAAERLPELVRALPDMMPAPAFCIMNPVFTRTYRDYLLQLVRAGVDGLQYDEIYFFPYFCGCGHCRRAFHEDTGWWLPLNELDPCMNNNRSPLWKAYLEWRKVKLADWNVEFRREAAAINPDLVLCKYTTHHGFSSSTGSLLKGSDLIECHRAVNYFGTEVMPRNCLLNARPLVPYRKMFNLLRETSHLPIWAFLYGSDHDAKYFGWAACNLAAQRGFINAKPGPGQANFVAFGANPDNMDIAAARPTAQVALLFSQHSRDWNQHISVHTEALGIAQTLEELHIPYRVLGDHLLTAERLKPFKALVVGAAGCLPDEAIAEIVRFAENGGTVLLTSVSGLWDELGNPRARWAFEPYFGFQIQPMHPRRDGLAKIGAVKPRRPVAWCRPQGKGAKAASALTGSLADGRSWPLVFEAKCGKGRLVYQACALGAALFMEEQDVGKPWKFALDEPLAQLCRDRLAGLLQDAVPWRVEAPPRVFTELYRQGDAFVAHFLNGQAETPKPGEILRTEPVGAPWPPCPQEIRFTLAAPQAREAYAVSPDFAGRQPLKITRDGAAVTVVLPRGLLRAYTLVWVK